MIRRIIILAKFDSQILPGPHRHLFHLQLLVLRGLLVKRASEIPHPRAAHLPYYLGHGSDCDRFTCQFLVRSFSEGCRFNLLYNIERGLEKCYIGPSVK